jgi:hypothetical protein
LSFVTTDNQTGDFEVQRYVKNSEGQFVIDGEVFTINTSSFTDDTVVSGKEYKYTFK